eukprot:snap_masked-scaffold_6-processed-gene-15.38-mRNA-1 protein AED:1.00 eAED:1.00 QI:0/0/0/0/1/1/2/0/80
MAFRRFAGNTLFFLWSLGDKLDCLQNWMTKIVDHILWVKTTKKDKIRWTLGNTTMKYVEELIIGCHGEFPSTLKNRKIGI